MKITKLKITQASQMKAPLYLDSLFDAKNGYGTVPNSESIDYFGFTIYMKPSEFLELAAWASLKPEFYEQLIKIHEPIGYPFLCVFEEDSVWKIWGHEGRHRMQAIKNVLGDNHLVPVHVFPRDMRNRSLTPELIAMPFLPEKKDMGKMTLREAHNMLKYFGPERIDLKSKHLNVGKYIRKTDFKHPALASSVSSLAAVWQSEMMVKHSPALLKKQNRNDDDTNEVLDMQSQPLHEYKNASIAPHGTSLPRRCN